MTTFASIDDYIDSFPPDVSTRLDAVRRTIRTAAPTSAETISYSMPSITLDGKYLVYFAAWKHHLGIYPVPTLSDALEAEVAPYRAAKDSVRFPFGEPIPYDLIGRVVSEVASRRATQR